MATKEKNDMRYVTGIPRKPLPKGRVLVHNQVVPQRVLGMNGFRAWTQTLDETLEVCDCDWAGVDLRGLVHYRVQPISTAIKKMTPQQINALSAEEREALDDYLVRAGSEPLFRKK